jgi:hypothetical protein
MQTYRPLGVALREALPPTSAKRQTGGYAVIISVLFAVAATVITCANVNDTAKIQAAVDTSTVVQLVGACKVDGYKSVRIPSGRTMKMHDATLRLVPGCASPGWPCRIFETVPGHGGIRFEGGTIIGDMAEQPTAAGFSIALRVDSSVPPVGERWSVVIEGTAFKQWRSDAIYVGGNTPSKGVRVTGVDIDGFGRNGFSATNADDVSIERLSCANAKVGSTPGACMDIESNPGERVTSFQAYDVTARDVEVCAYMHKHQSAQAQGFDYGVYRMRCYRARRHGIVMNSAVRGMLIGNVIEDAPIGVSIGAFNEDTRAAYAILSTNRIVSPRPIVLAGIRDSSVMSNDIGVGRIEAPGMGTSGAMIMSNVAPPPAPVIALASAAAPPPISTRKQPAAYPEGSKLSPITAPDDPFSLLRLKRE